MELCLYHPELGYYSRNAEQFGKAGDFYTSSDVHAVFGRLLARQFEEIWRALGSPAEIEILELGPGRGLFAQDVLAWSEKKFPEFFHALHYSLAERLLNCGTSSGACLPGIPENGVVSSVAENAAEDHVSSAAEALVYRPLRRRGRGCRSATPRRLLTPVTFYAIDWPDPTRARLQSCQRQRHG